MRTKTALLCLASMLALPAYALDVVPDEGAVASAYNLTFYVEPNLAAGTSYCLTFTTNGFFTGYPKSGTYTDSAGDFTGEWYENGDEVVMSGVYSPGGDSIPMVGRLLGPGNSKFGGRFLDFYPAQADASLIAGGTFFATKAASGCPAGNVRPAARKNGTGATPVN